MHSLRFAALAALLLAPAASATNLTFEQARDLVIADVIAPSPNASELVAFGYPTVLVPGDTVESSDDLLATTDITADTWFFWIDDDKEAHFRHDTRFVFVDDATATITVQSWNWWPAVNDVEIWSTRLERATSSDLIWGTPAATLPDRDGGDGHRGLGPGEYQDGAFSNVCLYMVSGADDTADTEFAKDKENVEAATKEYFGEDNVGSVVSRNNPTMAQLCQDLEDIANADPPCDKLVFFFGGHANARYLALRAHPIGSDDRELTGEELAAKLDDIDAPQWILIEACNAGAHVSPIDDADIEGHVAYSAAADKKSYFDPDAGSYWVTYFTDCMNDPNADGADQGTDVSAEEAAAWAEKELDESGDANQEGQDSDILEVHDEPGTGVCNDGPPAQAIQGGEGKPGLLGVPEYIPLTQPVLGGPFDLLVSNVLPDSPVFIIIGVGFIAAPFDQGILYPTPDLILPVPSGPTGQLLLPTLLPPDPAFCGLTMYTQAMVLGDPGAIGDKQTAQSNYIEVTFGN